MRVPLRGVYASRKKLADGTRRTYYFLRGFGALKPQDGDEAAEFAPGTPAFMRAYHAAIQAPRIARTHGTLQAIIDGYQRSPQYLKLAPRTKRDYDAALLRIGERFGDHPLAVIEDPKIRVRFLQWRDDRAKTSARQADALLGVLRIVIEWGRDRGLLMHNHATRPKKVYKADRADKLWLPPDIAALREVAEPEIRLAFELALGTGQRKGDLLELPWTAYDGQRIRLRQAKRKRMIDMPVTQSLKALLDAQPRTAKTILTRNGKPWGKVNFDHRWRETVVKAGRDGLHFHDLRGTACTILAQAGATPSEIAAMLGWTVSTVARMLDLYQAMTASLSDSAVAKLEARNAQLRNEVRNTPEAHTEKGEESE
ncbi:tyrosine-type recombinase/integrase [Sphingomonas desiccabilis]|uniref:Integrase n=1 Tax=Sphingomonas desiccabilis TaxID=429134 RepID=A0A4Q2IXD5_9SPHN|nr:tyrosine-type recombinase/integrase [Sphingomonas desiccabilis]MBB3910505.1 integrase [Sphingomonas desiccabilis]RXZ35146.1 integrase [Sphingomonas desiccabilis]